MIPQDNIKDFAVAAFRYWAYVEKDSITDIAEYRAITSVNKTFAFLNEHGAHDCVELVKRVYCRLPAGNIRKGLITHNANRAANSMYIDTRTVWRKLRRARNIFKEYYGSN